MDNYEQRKKSLGQLTEAAFSSIGSPLVNGIRKGIFRSSSAASLSTLTPEAWSVLKELSPRDSKVLMELPCSWSVTVRVFPSPATSDVSVARTTFSISTGARRYELVTEFWRGSRSRLSQILQGFPVRKVKEAHDYTVLTSLEITPPEVAEQVAQQFRQWHRTLCAARSGA